jgi:TPR repeat protein
MMGTALLATPAGAFDGAPTNQPALSALQHAAEDGNLIAQWKLGRMYAEGNGVAQNDQLAFDYFSRIVKAQHLDMRYEGGLFAIRPPPVPDLSSGEAQVVANAFISAWPPLSMQQDKPASKGM